MIKKSRSNMGLIKYLYIILIMAVLSLTLTAKSEPYSMPKSSIEKSNSDDAQINPSLVSWLQSRDHSVKTSQDAVKSLLALDQFDFSSDLKRLPCKQQKTELLMLFGSNYENLNLTERKRLKEINNEIKLNCSTSEIHSASYSSSEDLIIDFTED